MGSSSSSSSTGLTCLDLGGSHHRCTALHRPDCLHSQNQKTVATDGMIVYSESPSKFGGAFFYSCNILVFASDFKKMTGGGEMY